MNKMYFSLFFAATVLLTAVPGVNAQERFIPFNEFMTATRTQPATATMAAASAVVKDAASHQEMRQHLLKLYSGANVDRSYMLGSQTYDCVAVDQQPAVRALGLKSIATPPPQTALAKPNAQPAGIVASTTANNVISQTSEKFDSAGNTIGCAANSIPFRRLTLDEMSRFPTLNDFLQKRPTGSISSIAGANAGWVPPAVATHKYAITYQYVNNLGGNSSINLWRPYVNTGLGEIFSLAQQWYVGGSGASTQTAEVGWQNYPNKYNSQNSALFIYYTADNYSSTGCYNLDCAAFVQTNTSWHFGAGFANYSVAGGAQYDVAVQFYLYQGNWWLSLGGTWVGYYPGSLYRGGQLTRYAQIVEYGGETVGTTIWPPMGSGQWANTGFSHAAYQNNLFYINTSAGTVWDTLTPLTPSPACYSDAGPYTSTGVWTRYFYFGGPGGTGCQ